MGTCVYGYLFVCVFDSTVSVSDVVIPFLKTFDKRVSHTNV